MKRTQMQTVVNHVVVQSDYLMEFINDKSTNAVDRMCFMKELKDLCDFLLEARKMRFNVDNGCYPLDKKIAKLGSND